MNDSSPRHELHDISDLDPNGLPSAKRLIQASLVALAVAGGVLTIAILPAEYGLDPTGLGGKLGLTALHSASVRTPPAPQGPLQQHVAPYRTNTVTVTLAPRQGAEIKAVMEEGQSFVFEWASENGPVYVDMHGDPPNAPKDVFTSYWTGADQFSARGNFQAPFKGNHGWYWENRTDHPVTIRLKTSGFYESLFMP
ncbi:MAG: hypothetical protein JNJ44_06890 [Zoogloeaceae bacterium]|nr:hypothetical protein [Zoogloeaceae bacterium]